MKRIISATIMMVFGLMALPWTTIAATQPFQPDTGAEVQTSGLHGSQQMLNVSPVFRGVAMGGKWGLNVTAAQNLPNDYFLLLNRLKVNWVTVQVSLYINDSMDSNIQPRYAGVPFPTYTDRRVSQSRHQGHADSRFRRCGIKKRNASCTKVAIGKSCGACRRRSPILALGSGPSAACPVCCAILAELRQSGCTLCSACSIAGGGNVWPGG